MKLQERLPDSVTVDGKRIRVDLDFRNVLRMLETLGDENLMPDARLWLAARCVCRKPRPGVLSAVLRLIGFGNPVEAHERYTDFVQDADLIRAAFVQAYGIDLWTARLHWFRFSELVAAIPESTRYAQIVEIRARPLPKPTKYNHDEIESLLKAKRSVAIKVEEPERENKYQADVANVARTLLGAFGLTGSEGSESVGDR